MILVDLRRGGLVCTVHGNDGGTATGLVDVWNSLDSAITEVVDRVILADLVTGDAGHKHTNG
jgi:DNA-binding IscR family transcriptional regulator